MVCLLGILYQQSVIVVNDESHPRAVSALERPTNALETFIRLYELVVDRIMDYWFARVLALYYLCVN